MNLPSRFQLGDSVRIGGSGQVTATVVGISFREGKVLYDVTFDGIVASRVDSCDVFPVD